MTTVLSRAGGVDVSERLGCPFCAVAWDGNNVCGVSDRGAPEEVRSAAAIHVAPCWEEGFDRVRGPGSTEKLGHHPLVEVGRNGCVIEHSLHTEAVAGRNGDDGEVGGSQCRLLLTSAVWLEGGGEL